MMSVINKKPNVPELRFPEFDGDWSVSKIDDMAIVRTGSRDTQNRVDDGKYPFFVRSDKIERINSWALDCPAVLTSGDGVGVGKNIHYYEGRFDFHQRVYAIYDFDQRLDAKFFFQFFRESFLRRVMRLSAKNSVDSVRMSMITEMPVPLPKRSEQQKIAEFLSAVDEKIAQLGRKKALLEDYKKGCMQKLFSRELRFKDDNGNDFPDWEEKRLGGISKIYDGTHQTPVYVDTGVPFYSVEHVTSNNFQKTKYITEAVFENEIRRVRIEKNDILLTRIGDIGTSKLIDWDVRASFYVSLALLKINKSSLPRFISQFIGSDFFQKELWHRTIHVAFPKKINLGEIGNCRINIPHPDEQRKIADFLSAIDSKIDCVAQELAHAQTFKKGLLQKMFV